MRASTEINFSLSKPLLSSQVNRDAYGEFNYMFPPYMYEPGQPREKWREVGPREDNGGTLGGKTYDPWGTGKLPGRLGVGEMSSQENALETACHITVHLYHCPCHLS